MFVVLGLGNPGEEYLNTRHNAGRMALRYFAKKQNFDDFQEDPKLKALKSEAKIAKEKFLAFLPQSFMNKSGETAAALLRAKILKPDRKKQFSNLIVLHDDLDLALGSFKISFGKNSAGHKGVVSVIRALKSRNFIRLRLGISPKKKPETKKIVDFILGKFSAKELKILNAVFKRISGVIETIALSGVQKAMSEYN